MFLYLSLYDQFKALIENCVSDGDFIDPLNRKKINLHNYEDIFDGKLYKAIFESGCLTYNFFVDGVQISTTSKNSAWPVLLSVNELVLPLRRKHIIMASIWLSKKKPVCNQYLIPFVKESKELATRGVSVSVGGVIRTIHIKPVVCISDSIARPTLRNSTQFNGEFYLFTNKKIFLLRNNPSVFFYVPFLFLTYI